MLSNVFLKTLYEKRIAIIGWAIGILLAIIGVGVMFPSIKEIFGSQMAQIPKEFQGWFGENGNMMSSFKGYVATELVGNVGIMLVIQAIIFGSSLLAGDEENNVLQPLLTLPISRRSIYAQKWAALEVINLILVIVWAIAVEIAALLVHETVGFNILFRIGIVFFLTNLALATIAYSIGAMTGKRSAGGIFIGVYAFLAYFINALAGQGDVVKTLNQLSIFKYAGYIELSSHTILFGNIVVIVMALIIFYVLGLLIFSRRDIQMN
ncbi:ABC transporter permease subunit [Leuconostoc gasicomitatum]|uniref:ABC transporter permease subunit n=2 Tax=Leuconostoc TaxID=1243 RepID=UPI0007E16219|nr:ABC transporter permease subunit [Leuconostoc gasicomitatum]CUW10011.1 hypothetical protein PB1E_1607 [Leuconostoc gasicomitatum]